MEEKKRHKKGKLLEYKELKMQNYLVTDKLAATEAKFLFKIRTNMLNVKANFKEKYKNNNNQLEDDSIKCDICLKHIDDQQSLLNCESLNVTENIDYMNLFSDNISVAVDAVRKYRNIWRRRLELLK